MFRFATYPIDFQPLSTAAPARPEHNSLPDESGPTSGMIATPARKSGLREAHNFAKRIAGCIRQCQQLGDDRVAERYFTEERAAERDRLPGNDPYPFEIRLTYGHVAT